jgi:WD40 repeat protein
LTIAQLSRWVFLLLLGLGFSRNNAGIVEGQETPAMKLVVDEGRYGEESFSRQIAVSSDDTVVLTSDFQRGVRTFDMASGKLISHLEGHTLAGDVYYDPRTELFVTSGDRKIKIWDWRQQKLVKSIIQPFHSQFITHVYVDSKKTYVFAEYAKYSFATGKIISGNDQRSWAVKLRSESKTQGYFWDDKYYVFEPTTGQVSVYDCLSDKLLKSYTLSAYQPGINNYFDYDSGRLFISYTDGVRIVELSDGSSDRAYFDRPGAFDNLGETSCYGLSPDGRYLVAGSDQGAGLVVLKKIDARKGFADNAEEVFRKKLSIGEIHALHHSNKVVYTTEGALHLLDLDTMRVVWNTEAHVVGLRNLYLAPDNQHLYLELGGERVSEITFQSEHPAYQFAQFFNRKVGVWGTFKPELCKGDLPAELVPLWDNRPRTVRMHLDQGMSLESVEDKPPFPVQEDLDRSYTNKDRAFSLSKRYSVLIKDFGDSTVSEGDRLIGRMPDRGVIYVVKFSPDEHYVAIGGSGRWVTVMDLTTGKIVQRVYGESYIVSVTFSSDNQYLFTSSEKNEIMMWNLTDGKFVRKFTGTNGRTNDTAITRDGKTLLSTADDGSMRLWEVATGKLLLTTFVVAKRENGNPGACGSNPDNNWVAVTPDGHFDSSDLDQTRELHWLTPDAALRPLPLEIFMRDYYEPRLLSKVFKRAKLAPVRPLQNLDRELPVAKIERVDLHADPSAARGSDSAAPVVSVSVSVESVRSAVQKDMNGNLMESGAYDLRLFRNGQLVAQWPDVAPDDDTKLGSIDNDSKREAWRRLHAIQLDASGRATVTFQNIKLPRADGKAKIEFTAYAFNQDRVKSLTTPAFEYQLSLNGPAKQTPRHAYLILMAVNANQSHWNLEVAVPGADSALKVLRGRLREQYSEVTEIQLYSDLAPDSAQVASTKARKKYLQSVLDLLAGRPIDPGVRREIDPGSQLREATPDDAVVLYVASHGYVDPSGTFYLVPYDTGSSWGITEDILDRCSIANDHSQMCKDSEFFLHSSISSGDLAAWWHGVDAGEVVMILDSCHSGAAAGKEFRPGPLGDPGLGQLSYDKAMRILAASQPAQTERGTWIKGGDGQTLLVVALETIASANPKWTLAELLKGTEQELPQVMKRLYPQMSEDEVQLPELLDFSGRKPLSTVGEVR